MTAAPAAPAVADPATVGLSAERLLRLRETLEADVRTHRVPGAVWMIVRRGQLVCREAIGEQDPEAHTPMRADSIFRIYSMTKPIVSVTAMMLMEEGRLHIADPIRKYLPEFADMRVAIERDGGVDFVSAQREITIQDLLRHTSGLTYQFLGESAVQKMYAAHEIGSLERDSAQFSAAIAALPLMHQPGTVWHYGHSTDVLGRLLEVISGQSLGELLAQRVLDPLGMVDTAFHVPARKHDRIAQPFATDPDSGAEVRLVDARHAPRLEMGGGGLLSTAPDYARFLAMLAGGGEFAGQRLIGRKALEYMTADHLGAMPVSTDLLPPGHGFGMGFAVRTHTGMAPLMGSIGTFHWGGIAGTSFWIDPAEQMSAVLLTQAPYQRHYLRVLFRNMVYAAIED